MDAQASVDHQQRLRAYLRSATAELHDVSERLADLETRAHEPVAIVAMSCRLPGGVDDPESFWLLLAEGRDAISPLPTDRGWPVERLHHPDPDHGGTTYCRHGGFLTGAGDFDPAFFGMSPREAAAIDPQQRLVLETSWEVLERGRIDPRTVRGGRIGVFVGAWNTGYGLVADGGLEQVDGEVVTGGTLGLVSGRVSYVLGLHGPTMTVDTACSSSLTALHLAVRSLRARECTMALAGGVTVMASPVTFTAFSRQRALAADGRCKAFSAGADGFGPAEGVGMLLLERLSDARRHGHPVLAVVRGSAVNSDGASNGLTAPNGEAQQRVIRQALTDARLAPADVDVVEAHGTGTALGDPIEARALAAAYGRDRARPLWLGSVKSNIGHTQGAAGVAGVIKTVLALRHETVPRTLHAEQPSPHVDWSTVRPVTAPVAWPRTDRLRRAGVSSFGLSGTNAHVIIEEAPDGDAPEPGVGDAGAAGTPRAAAGTSRTDGAPVVPWVLSARSPAALREQAARLAGWPVTDPADVGFSLAGTRSVFEHRAVLVGTEPELRQALRNLAAGGDAPPARAIDRVVFVFPGQGGQWAGMATDLLAQSPVFAASMRRCADALSSLVDWSLPDVLRDPGALARVDVVQPALFAVMVSLAEVWRSHGVRPAAVLGHSQGEIAAACVAGALTLPDAAKVAVLRSRAVAALSGSGGMLFVGLPEEQVRARWGQRVSVAVVNGPRSVVVAGGTPDLAELAAACAAEGVRAQPLPVDYPSHSSAVEAVRADVIAALADLDPRKADVPMLSSVTADWLDGPVDADYWYRNLRETVRFEQALRVLAAQGHRAFVECSAHPVLVPAIEETVDDVVAVGSLRRDEGGMRRFWASMGEAYVAGVDVDFTPAFPDARRVDLPTYPFQHRRFWLDRTADEPVPVRAPDADWWAEIQAADLPALARALSVDADALAQVVPALSTVRDTAARRGAADAWRYRVQWKPATVQPAVLSGQHWLVVAPAGGASADWVVRAIESRGGHATVRELDAVLPDRRRYAAALGGSHAGVVSLLAFEDRPYAGPAALPASLAATVCLAQALGDVASTAPLWMVTPAAAGPAAALVEGFGRVVGLEHPDRWGGLVRVRGAVDERTFADVLAGPEDQVLLDGAGVRARRVVPAPLLDRSEPRSWTPRGSVLVTGGTGALGGHVARWLARAGAEHLVLAGRRGPEAPAAAELRRELTALGAEVTVAACDVADPHALAELLARHPVTAVVHAAGTAQFTAVADTTPEQAARVLSAKVAGAANLDRLLPADLDAFVLFSSSAGVWGSGHLGAYAAANAYLDALAEDRRSRGLVATSVAWGLWDGPGMSGDEGQRFLRHRGLLPMAPDIALTALHRAIEHDDAAVVVASVDWAAFAAGFTAARARPLIDDIPQVRAALDGTPVDPGDEGSGPGRLSRLAGLPAAERHRELLQLVRAQAAAVLGHADAAAVPPTGAFRDLGFDSLTAVQLRNRLAAATGLVLPSTAIFEHPDVSALSEYLLGRFDVAPGAAPAGGLLRALYGSAAEQGRILEFVGTLRAAASYRPVFHGPSDLPEPLRPVPLAAGSGRWRLVCCSGTAATAGPHEFARVAAHLRGAYPVQALSLPGYRPGEPLPATLEAVLAVQAAAVAASGQPVVLAGHSAGALMAYALATHLCRRGTPPVGVALLDVYPPGAQDAVRAWSGQLATRMLTADHIDVDDTRLTAMGAYDGLWDGWRPEVTDVPVLLVRAADPLAPWTGPDNWRASWPFVHTAVDVPGDHFTMMREHAAATAHKLGAWLDDLTG